MCGTSYATNSTGPGSGQPDGRRNDEAIEHWVKKRWPQLKKGKAPERIDRVRGRIRRLAAAVSESHLGAQRADTSVAPSVRLEAAVHRRRAGVRTGWQ